ncbi:MAG: ribbon-helix-helix protein, CopG family [Rectinemataceae bacterium]|jgi:hypothetical protein
MEKLQILFPEPQLRRLRRVAAERDSPVSELIRAAVDAWLERNSDAPAVAESPPAYSSGGILRTAGELREAAYEDGERLP